MVLALLGAIGLCGLWISPHLSVLSEDSLLQSERERLHRGLAQHVGRQAAQARDQDVWGLNRCPDVSPSQVFRAMEDIAAQHGRRPRVVVFTAWSPFAQWRQFEGRGLLVVDDEGTHAYRLREGAAPAPLPRFDEPPRAEAPSPRLHRMDGPGLDAYLARLEAGDEDATRRLMPMVRRLHAEYLALERQRHSVGLDMHLAPIDLQGLDRGGSNPLPSAVREALISTMIRHVEFASEPFFIGSPYPVFFTEHGACAAWDPSGNASLETRSAQILSSLAQDGVRAELTPERVRADVRKIDALDGIRPPTLGARLDAILGLVVPPGPDADAGEDVP